MAFLPMNIKEVKARGWDEVDFVYVMGDSYVDHFWCCHDYKSA